MTTAMMTDLDLMRTRVSGAIGHHLPGHVERLGWDAGAPSAKVLITNLHNLTQPLIRYERAWAARRCGYAGSGRSTAIR